MLVIRFSRIGRKKQAFFKLVVAEKARAVQKKITKDLGYFNPLSDGGKGEFVFDADSIKKYIANGAQLSQTAARMLTKNGVKEAEKFIEKRTTKPKKEKAPAPAPETAPVAEAAPAEETPAEEKTE
ncbi:30S ribosomal protein S16 [bacterium]|jgi:small subunit ribosomal protein S16|nr:30S ribosomal protein S16 [bacterium]MBT6832396.1 30S ribosomal protein S16 [bacterium]MBT6995941.1 30S ribosomal protein S16 [bacterium]MBT7772802.1 30S ribosomal protein S16 [bacterium]